MNWLSPHINAAQRARVGDPSQAPAPTVEKPLLNSRTNMRFTVLAAIASAALVAGSPVR